MRKLILILLFISAASFAQQWKYENNMIIWEQVINESITSEEAKQIAVNFPGHFIMDTENRIVFQIEMSQLPYQKYGGGALSTPFFARDPFNAKINIFIQPERYKIEFSEFKIMNEVWLPAGVGFEKHLIQRGDFTTKKGLQKWLINFSDYLQKNTNIRGW